MQDNNRPLLIILIIIGIFILIALLSPRMRGAQSYSYRGYGLTASTVPLGRQRAPDSEYYTIYRYIPTQHTTYTQSSSYPTYYPSQPSTAYPGETVFPDGCTLTSPTSTTTGLPCS